MILLTVQSVDILTRRTKFSVDSLMPSRGCSSLEGPIFEPILLTALAHLTYRDVTGQYLLKRV